MCQIIIKPQYYSMPPDKYIVNSYNNNSDGFGLAYWEQGMKTVHIRKGAMSIKKIFRMIDGIPNAFDKTIVMHFRLATDGDICPANCHPFPIVKDVPKLQALNLDCQQAIAHNGIIIDLRSIRYLDAMGYYSSAAPSEAEKLGLSDTQEFIYEYLAGFGKALYNKSVKKMIEAFTDSKFATLAVGGRVDLIGEFIKDGGLYYSSYSYKWNNLYVPPKKTKTNDTSFTTSPQLRYDRKTKCWLNPAYHPDADFDEDELPIRYGFCDICQKWGKLTEFEECWICGDCHKLYEQGIYTNV